MQKDVKIVVREVTEAEEQQVRELATGLGLSDQGFQRVLPDSPTSVTGKTKIIQPQNFSLVLYVMGQNPARKLAELIGEKLGKECTVQKL